jgi:ATP-dependent DNA ligase
MTLPLSPPLAPALALSRKELPVGEEYAYEIKLDGFRCIAFVDREAGGAAGGGADGEAVYLQSRGSKPLQRYFPELVLPAGRYVLDGEIVIRDGDGREQFDLLQQRIHPAASRIELLSGEIPATYVAFDLLAREDESLLELPFEQRRAALERLFGEPGFADAPVELMPSTGDAPPARAWLEEAEGAIAKLRSAPYEPGKRTGMFKVKRVRTIDAVVAGWRPGKEQGTVGALILALYDGPDLRVVGHCSGLSAAEKRRLVSFLAPYETGERGSADPSRWSAGRDLEWVALRPELVVEIDFDHVSGGRIRHGAKLNRWREDKPPRECAYDQLH